MNDHYAETIDIVFKIGLLANLLSDNITAKFHYFSMKTENVTWKIRKAINFLRTG